MKIEEKKLILGLLFIPAFLLQQSILIRSIQFIIIIAVYISQGGKFRIVPNLILFSGIVFAYIIRPSGKVLFMLFEFPVTKGALFSGLTRSLMLIGLIYISRLSVSSKLDFKGAAGNLVGRVFYYFEAITFGQGKFRFKDFYKRGITDRLISYLDKLLEEVENNTPAYLEEDVGAVVPGSKYLTGTALIFILINYALLIYVI